MPRKPGKAPNNSPNLPDTRGQRERAVARSSRGGSANELGSEAWLFNLMRDSSSEEMSDTDSSSEEERPGTAPTAGPSAGTSGSAGGTMVAGGMRAATMIPAPLQLLEGPFLQQRRFRFQCEIKKSWPGSQIWANGPQLTASVKSIEWASPYYMIPKVCTGIYINQFLGSWLDRQQYWRVIHAGLKITKVEFVRKNRQLVNPTTPTIRIDSAWQPTMIVLKGNAMPVKQYHLYYDQHSPTDAQYDQRFAKAVDCFDRAAGDEMPHLPNVGFTMQTNVGAAGQVPQPRLPRVDGDPTTHDRAANWDFFQHRAQMMEMNGPGPTFESRPMKAWREGYHHAVDMMECFDTNPNSTIDGVMYSGNQQMAPPFAINQAVTNPATGDAGQDRYMGTNKRLRRPNGFPPVKNSCLFTLDGNKQTNFRNTNDGYYPHITDDQQSNDFIRFARPPQVENDETEWLAMIDMESEIVGEWTNSFPTEDILFHDGIPAGDQDIRYTGDRRHVMVQNIDSIQYNAAYENKFQTHPYGFGTTKEPI